MILVLWAGRHDATAILRTKFCYRTIQHIDLIEKIHGYTEKERKRDGEYGFDLHLGDAMTTTEYSLLTATHSLRSSPSGSATAFRRLPEPNVAAACFIRSYWCVPSGIFFFGLNVLLDRLMDFFFGHDTRRTNAYFDWTEEKRHD